MARASLDLIGAMRRIAERVQPVTGRGVGYKLFVANLIQSMSRGDMQRVYRLLVKAREDGIIPWEWIVDEAREMERISTWDDPAQYAFVVARAYRRDFWNQQPIRVVVVSEKGTVRGVVKPVLDAFQVGFLSVHGFSSATKVRDLADDDDGRPLILLYVGDWDPSGLYMSEVDLPERLERYGGDHVEVRRIALLPGDLAGLPSFPASDKKKDPRYRWFVKNHGSRCWELDAMDPNDLRERVKTQIEALIDREAWERCDAVNRAEQESMRTILTQWSPQGG
jgi:hypothetical protein